MKKHKFYFTGTNANFAEVLNAMKGIFNVDVLPYLKGEKQQTYLYDSFRMYEENRDDLLPVGSSELQRAINEGWIDILEAAMLKNNSFNYLGNLWDKMRTYFLDNAATKTFLYNPITYKYTVTDKPKVIVLPPTIGTDTGTGTGASNPTGTGASGTNTGIVLPTTPPEDSSRDQKLRYFTQLGNSKGYTWEQGFKRDWYALANTLPVLDREFVKQHIDFMINQQKSNATGAKDVSKDEIKDFKQAVEFVPTVKRDKFKIKKGFLFYLFASPKAKAAIKAEEEKKYNEAVQNEEREFIQAEQNTMQKNANVKKLIADKILRVGLSDEIIKTGRETLKYKIIVNPTKDNFLGIINNIQTSKQITLESANVFIAKSKQIAETDKTKTLFNLLNNSGLIYDTKTKAITADKFIQNTVSFLNSVNELKNVLNKEITDLKTQLK
jgi:hypothetical protein